ncbi:hypothetical protein ACFYYB_40910 [Streptomyces sp. NPDC002886]|uniref:hypothetical protein n=1 Tax=Streptomyces sp. NPDC002886 TaxID=3364667 RepID=UPI0036CA600A
MLLEGLAGKPLPTVRPDECSGLNDAQWVELAAEQSRRLAEVSGGTAGSAATAPAEEPAVTEVTFKVWGKAPSGTTITYGSDSQNLEGSGLPMTRTLKFKADALYYHLTAQLHGGGDIHCSVTLGSQTKEGQARGGYNICSAQINLL